jgi:steroid delta-isomerase-like uncharacterized protein
MNENNRRLAIRWFEEVWGQRRVATIHELLAPDSVGHLEGGEITGSGAFADVHREVLTAMPDLVMEIEDCIADGDDAVVRWNFRGTHTGNGLGCAATHREVRCGGMTWFKFRNGVIAEGWDRWNWDAFMKALQPA